MPPAGMQNFEVEGAESGESQAPFNVRKCVAASSLIGTVAAVGLLGRAQTSTSRSFIFARVQAACGEAVSGANERSVWFGSSEGMCQCPDGTVVQGDDPLCIGTNGLQTDFLAEQLVNRGCSCGQRPSYVGQGEDGNPWDWDRYRRCDHGALPGSDSGYTPACGPCEGVGGTVWSDDAGDITLAPCNVVARPADLEATTLARPVWGAEFTVSMSHEILIGKKTDPACFGAFPNNDSASPMCYKPQDVQIYSDMFHTRALRIDSNQAGNAWGLVGNVTSTIYHQGEHMWISNQLPFGITQTICTVPRQGGDPEAEANYPVQFNWTDNLMFVARERIGVEYGVGEKELDHWAFGPHHAWTDPASGIIVRMWQPFNGLQIFEPGAFKQGVNRSLFEELSNDGSTAPLAARAGGSTFRVKCKDDGFPEGGPGLNYAGSQSTSLLETRFVSHGSASRDDLRRARTKVPRADFSGENFESMSETLNTWLLRRAPNSRECDAWTVEELQQLQFQLFALRDPDLDDVYQSSDDNRRLLGDRDEIAREWEELNALAASDPDLARIHRDGHCHEAVMWYAHHIPESLRNEFGEEFALPLLQSMRHDVESPQPLSFASVRVHQAYDAKVTCADCHSNALPTGSSQMTV